MTRCLKLHFPIVFILLTSSFLNLNCSENAITNDGQRQHLVIVLDGLRPDYITNELMPNLYRLGQEGVVGENHHVAYPTVTRVNSPSIATGAYPGTHGLMHNHIYLPEISDESIHTGDDVDIMMRVDPLLTATSLGELLERHDLTKQLFDEVGAMLEERGLLMRQGTIVDATIIAAPKPKKPWMPTYARSSFKNTSALLRMPYRSD
jgi:hypothetical protein